MRRTRFGIALARIALAGTVGGWPAATRAQQGAPYTDQQTAAGQAAYVQSCGGCHGRTLSGAGEAPSLAGSAFMASWGSQTTRELFARIRLSMPPDNPNGLSPDTYASIVAFLLKANGPQAGSSAVTPETSVTIASIANGQMPAALTVAGSGQARGSRGRGGRGRGGADDDSTTTRAPRTGLTVPGTVKSYSPVTEEMLAHPPDADWLMHYRTYSGWSNSPLNQITVKNVSGLQLKWAWPLEDGARQQITPLVHDGIMFLSTNITGGHNWQSTSYDPANDLLLIPLSQNCAMYGAGGQLFYEMPGTDGDLGRLSAYETNTMRPVWSFQQRSPFLTGVMSTAGGVGFVGDFDRVFRAFDVRSGKTLWETRLPTTAQGYPVTFSVGGDQFVAVPTGYNGGSPEQEPTTMLRGEVQRPTIGHGVYVFALPKGSGG